MVVLTWVLSWFVPSVYPQQKTLKIELFQKALPANYATKLATENKGFTFQALTYKMRTNPDLKIVFVTRHPFDNILSKIRRGAPKSLGGDNGGEDTMPDGTLIGAWL